MDITARLSVTVIAAAAAVAALAGCSSGSSGHSNSPSGTAPNSQAATAPTTGSSSSGHSAGAPTGSAAAIDPCALITAADASAASGVQQPATKSVDTTVTTVCNYLPTGVPYSRVVHVQVVVPDEEPDLDSFRKLRASDHDQQPVAVGAASSFWDDTTGTLSLWQHDHEVDIMVSNSWYGWSKAQSKAVATQLAKVALGRL